MLGHSTPPTKQLYYPTQREEHGRKTRPRVLHLINSLNVGGTERQCVQLVKLLRGDHSYEVFIACQNIAGPLREELHDIGMPEVPHYPLTSFYNLNALVQMRKFARLLRRYRISIIHTHDFYTNVFGMVAAAIARVPVRIASRREMSLFNGKQRAVERLAFNLADAVIANCERIRLQLTAEGVPDRKIVTIYNGVDLRRFAPATEAVHSDSLYSKLIPPRQPRCRIVTMVANMRHGQKDYPSLLRAALEVRKSVPEVIFVVAGEGELSGEVRALTDELGLTNSVKFIGRCNTVAELLALSDVCVLSSKSEGFSNVVLEYMAAAKPAVVTDVGGAAEAITDNVSGFLVPPGTPRQLAEKIILLLNNPALARSVGKNARQVAGRRFSTEQQLTKTVELYSRLIAAKSVR